jgi:chromosome segregation ATPase
LRAAHAEKETKLTDALGQWESSYQELSQAKEEYEKENDRLHKKLLALQATIERQEREAEESQRQAPERERLLAKRAIEEKAALEATYEQSITELRSQLAANRIQLEKVVNLRNEADESTKVATLEAAKSEKEARKVGSELRCLKGQIDRERKVAEAALQAAKATAEAEYYRRLEEHRSRMDAEKHAILTIGIDAFHGLFHPSDSINERTFKTVVTKAAEQLARLTTVDRTIRKMLRAGDQQTTEDAVAQALFRDQVSE